MNLLFLLREYMFSGDVNKLNLSCQSLYSCSLVNTWYDEWLVIFWYAQAITTVRGCHLHYSLVKV